MSYTKTFLYLLSTSVIFASACKSSTVATSNTPTPKIDNNTAIAKTDTVPSSDNTVNVNDLISDEPKPVRSRDITSTAKAGGTITEGKSALDAPLPLNPAVRTGVLANGMKYYIQRNTMPEKRVELRLAVNAGSMQEDEDQLGLAHFVEHMAFNGTTNFEKNKLVSFLENTGVRFGADLNAYTSFDETVYMLQLPTDRPGLVDTGLLVMSDWTTGIAFEGEEIDKERGVIASEYRTGLGAGERMRQAYWPKIFKDSRYAKRLPIGSMAIIQGAAHERFRQFYKDWYRPNLMALVVVGDIDVDAVEAKVKENFSKLKNPDQPRAKEIYEVPNHKETLVGIATDKEESAVEINVFYKHPATTTITLKDFRTSLTHNLFNAMFASRLEEVSKQKDAPFYSAYASYGSFVRAKDAYGLSIKAKEKSILEALKTVLLEQRRVILHGFTESELERQKLEILKYAERAAKEEDKMRSSNLAMTYVSHFLENAPAMDAKQELQLTKNFIDAITLEDVNVLLKEWLTVENRAVIATGPQKDGFKMPTEAEFLAVLEASEQLTPEAYKDKYEDMPLFDKELKGGHVATKKEMAIDKMKYTEVKLTNGITVHLYPTTHTNDQIIMSGISAGGHSLYEDKDFMSASMAASVIGEGGIGKFDYLGLDRKLAGKNVGITPFIDERFEGFTGNSSVEDFEVLLQLTHLYATQPRKDADAFERLMESTETEMEGLLNNPQYYFFDKFIRATNNNHIRKHIFPSKEDLKKVNLDRAFEIYKERFHDCSDFKFVFVGNINEEKHLPLIAKYLGTLPGKGRTEKAKDIIIPTPTKAQNIAFQKGLAPQSNVGIMFKSSYDGSLENTIKADAMGRILDIMVRENLREDKGGVYSPSVSTDTEKLPKPVVSTMIYFQCAPETADMLIEAVKDEVKSIQANGGGEENLKKVKEMMLRERETQLQNNSFWRSLFVREYAGTGKIADFTKFDEIVKAITLEDITALAKTSLDLNKVLTVKGEPEEGTTAP